MRHDFLSAKPDLKYQHDKQHDHRDEGQRHAGWPKFRAVHGKAEGIAMGHTTGNQHGRRNLQCQRVRALQFCDNQHDERNRHGLDEVALGADGAVGGEGENADIGAE